jgi:hypothetical protein
MRLSPFRHPSPVSVHRNCLNTSMQRLIHARSMHQCQPAKRAIFHPLRRLHLCQPLLTYVHNIFDVNKCTYVYGQLLSSPFGGHQERFQHGSTWLKVRAVPSSSAHSRLLAPGQKPCPCGVCVGQFAVAVLHRSSFPLPRNARWRSTVYRPFHIPHFIDAM